VPSGAGLMGRPRADRHGVRGAHRVRPAGQSREDRPLGPRGADKKLVAQLRVKETNCAHRCRYDRMALLARLSLARWARMPSAKDFGHLKAAVATGVRAGLGDLNSRQGVGTGVMEDAHDPICALEDAKPSKPFWRRPVALAVPQALGHADAFQYVAALLN